MATEEPPFLAAGTEVSAKYRGAFCEAKVKKVTKIVKCKVTVKDSNLNLVVTDEDLKGPLKLGGVVEVKLPDSGEYAMAVVHKITDQSMYTVIFDDGDENTLRRTQLCLKGEKHFVKSDTLDELPLTNPEHFGTPVVKTANASKRKRLAAGSDQDSDGDSSDDGLPSKRMYRGRLQDLIGRVLCIELEDRKGTTWVPVLIVQSSADDSELESKDHLLVKSFRDSKFYTVTKKLSREFTREMAVKNEDKAIKPAFEKALLYYDTRLLPQGWDREDLLGSDTEDGEDIDESSDSEPNEEKDHFVAQLYKFMDDRGTPINKAPVITGKDLNLYRLFRVVQNLGGYNRVTNQMKWRIVYSRMNLIPSSAASNQIKVAYKKYLHAFEDFYRKLGSTMGTISRPGGRGRHSSSGRSLVSIRNREGLPKSPRATKKAGMEDVREKQDVKAASSFEVDELAEKGPEKEATKSEGRPKPKPAAAAVSEPQVKDQHATSGAAARESRSEGRPETRASLEDRDLAGVTRGSGKSVVREGEKVRKIESQSGSLGDSPRRRVSRLLTEHRRVAAREARERETKRAQMEKVDDTIADVAEEGRKELRTECVRRKREDDVKEAREEGCHSKTEGGRDNVTPGKREDGGKDVKEANRKTVLVSPRDDGKRGKQEESRKEAREDLRRGKLQESRPDTREETIKVKEEDKKGAVEKRVQKVDLEKEDLSESDEKEGNSNKLKKRVTRKKMSTEAGMEDTEAGKADKKTKEVKIEKPKEVKIENTEKPEEEADDCDESEEMIDMKDDKRQEGEYPIGTKLKVKYGRGRNQKLYEAKVVEKQRESNLLHYRVHYDGWNKRYDEWIRKERIMGVVEEPQPEPPKKTPKTPGTKAKVETPVTKAKVEMQGTKAKVEALVTKAKVEMQGTKAKVETPVTKAKVEMQGTKAKLEALVTKAKVETPGTKAKVETPLTKSKVEMQGTKAKLEALVTKAKVETPGMKAKLEALVTKAKVETPGTKAKVETPVTKSKVETQGMKAKLEALVTKSKVETPGTKAKVETPVTKSKVETQGTKAKLETPVTKAKVETPGTKSKVLVKKCVRPPDSQSKAKSPVSAPCPAVAPSAGAPSRPTRSNSIETSLSTGLPMKAMRPRCPSGHNESSDPQTHSSESEGGEGDGVEEEPSRLETGADKQAADDAKDDTDVTDDASPAPLTDPAEDLGELAVKDEEDEGEVEAAVLEPRTLRRREDAKATVVTKGASDATESVEGKVDTVVAMVVEGTDEVKVETEKVATEDVESVSEAKAAPEGDVGGDDDNRPDVTPVELSKIEAVEQTASGDETVEKKPGKPRTRRREVSRQKPSVKVAAEASEKAEETEVKSEDVGSASDVAAATESEEQDVVKTREEEKVDEEEKQEKGRKRPKITKVKPFEKTPKGKGKLEKGERPKGRPPKLKLEAAATPGENAEVKPKKRLKRKLVEKVGNDAEGSSDLAEKKAQLEVPDTKVSFEKSESKPEAVVDDVLGGILPSNDAACSGSDVVTDTSGTSKCASPDRQGSPNAEAAKLSDSVSVEVSATGEVAEKARDLSPVATTGVEQGKDVAIAVATSQPEAASTDVQMSPASKPVASTLIFDNTPPSTPEHGTVPEHSEEPSSVRSSNQPDEVHSTKSEYEANLEVAALMAAASGRGGDENTEVPTQACESPIACDMSTVSNSSGGSSGNAPGSESEGPPGGILQKDDDDSGEPLVKRRKRTHKRPASGIAVTEKAKHRLMAAPTIKPELSDSDEGPETRGREAASDGSSSPLQKPTTAVSVDSPDNRRPPRTSKYNFVEALEEGKYLAGEKRIDFLVDKIQEIRKIYMQLKAEVACIDRRRKRHRRRERESNRAASGDQHQQTPSHMDVECS